MVKNYAIVINGVVDNYCRWDGELYDPATGKGWTPPEGAVMVPVTDTLAGHGATWDGKVFTPAELVQPQPTLDQKLAAAGLTAADIKAAIAE